MNILKLVIIFSIVFLSSCSQKFQNNGLLERNIKNFKINIGKTSKEYLIDNYGPPVFENIFNDNVIYYISHVTSYKTFDKRKTEKLRVLEIILDDKNIVQKVNKYSEKDSRAIKISENQDEKNINFTNFWKDIIRAMTRKNTVD